MLSVRTSAIGHGQGERSGPWPWDTSAQPIDAPPPLSPRSNAQLSTTTEKSKNFAFLEQIWEAEAGWTAPEGPGGVAGAARRRLSAQITDCAVGSG